MKNKLLIILIISFIFHLGLKAEFEAPLIDADGRFQNTATESAWHYIFESATTFVITKLFQPYCFVNLTTINEWTQKDPIAEKSEILKIYWLGHATFLIQINNINILTDPIFYDLEVVFYPRKTPIGIDSDTIPKIDIILISHNHRDHMDENSLKFLQKKFDPLCLVPLGNKPTMKSFGFQDTKLIEFTWWENHPILKEDLSPLNLAFTFLPAIHWSNRTPWDINKTLWGSWMITSLQKNIYFAGDSAYGNHFKKIAEVYPQIDIAMLPIGPNEPRKQMVASHMSAEESVQAFKDLNAHNFIPMHWGTFALGTDSFETPIEKLTEEWRTHSESLTNKELGLLKFGQQFS